MLHAIIPFKSPSSILHRLKDADVRYFFHDEEAGSIFLVSYEGTTGELAKLVGLSKEQNTSSGVVLAFDNYAGFANPDIWEWLRKYDDNY
ncbi:MAG: hypothetical protein F4147_02830 [Gammaproteobacteria bacterium]|nr:hypothetical protein [Gammaproteobacteria bacterium]